MRGVRCVISWRGKGRVSSFSFHGQSHSLHPVLGTPNDSDSPGRYVILAFQPVGERQHKLKPCSQIRTERVARPPPRGFLTSLRWGKSDGRLTARRIYLHTGGAEDHHGPIPSP
ncbi:hypothetical protein VUR80DRAFT_6254 [Thermomyces stellatus]